MNPLLFFWTFFKASLLSTGGMGNLPFLNKDLIDFGWAQPSDFLTAIAVGQLSPGPSGLWSISLGYLTYGWLGAILALLALSLPPLLALGVVAVYGRVETQPVVQNFTRGLSLAIVGLSLAVSFSLAKSTLVDASGFLIAAAAMGLALSKKVPIILILVLAAIAGVLIYGTS